MTLEDVSARLEAAVRACNAPGRHPGIIKSEIEGAFRHPEYYASFCDLDPEDWNRHPPVVRAFHRAARLYVIARDEGMDAALLWKLTKGGAA